MLTAKNPVLRALTSLQLTIVCLAALMILVTAATLAQVGMGTAGAVNAYMRSYLVWWNIPGSQWMIPVFPGGATVGLVLMVNLVAAQAIRLQATWSKAGLWLVHLGLILFVGGEFVSGMFQVESQMAIENGQTVNFVEGRDPELVLIDVTDPAWDEVYAIRTNTLSREGTVAIPGTPVTLKVHQFAQNAQLRNRTPFDPPSRATAGVGTAVTLIPARAGHRRQRRRPERRLRRAHRRGAELRNLAGLAGAWARPSRSPTRGAPTRWPCATGASTCPTR